MVRRNAYVFNNIDGSKPDMPAFLVRMLPLTERDATVVPGRIHIVFGIHVPICIYFLYSCIPYYCHCAEMLECQESYRISAWNHGTLLGWHRVGYNTSRIILNAKLLQPF